MQAGERKLLISVWRCESLLQSDMCYFCQMARNANLFFQDGASFWKDFPCINCILLDTIVVDVRLSVAAKKLV